MRSFQQITIFIIYLAITIQCENVFRGLFIVKNWTNSISLQQATIIAKDKVMLRHNESLFIANITNPLTPIRNITSSYSANIDVSISYISQTLLYAKNNSVIGDTAMDPHKLTIQNISKSNILQRHKDMLIYDDQKGNLYGYNQTSSQELIGLSIKPRQTKAIIACNAIKDRIVYYNDPYLLIFDSTLETKQILKTKQNIIQIKFSDLGKILTIKTDTNIKLILWDQRAKMYLWQNYLQQFQESTQLFAIFCFDTLQLCQFNAGDKLNIRNIIGNVKYNATAQKVVQNLGVDYVQLLDDRQSTAQGLVAGINILSFYNASIHATQVDWLGTIYTRSINAEIFVQNIIITNDLKWLIAININSLELQTYQIINGEIILKCQGKVNHFINLNRTSIKYHKQSDWLLFIEATKLTLFRLSTCQLINQTQISIQTYFVQQKQSTIRLLNQKNMLYFINISTLQQIRLQYQFNTTKHIFVKDTISGSYILIGFQSNQQNRVKIIKYGSNYSQIDNTIIDICLYSQSIFSAGIDYFKVICKLTSKKQLYLVSVFNLTTLFIIRQYSIKQYIDFSLSDCTSNMQFNFRNHILFQAGDTYFNLSSYKDGNWDRIRRIYINSTVYIEKAALNRLTFEVNISLIKIQNKNLIKIKQVYLPTGSTPKYKLAAQEYIFCQYYSRKNDYFMQIISIFETDALDLIYSLNLTSNIKEYPLNVLDKNGYLYVVEQGSTIGKYEFKTYKTILLKSIKLITCISLSNNNQLILSAGFNSDNQFIIQKWKKYPSKLIDIFKTHFQYIQNSSISFSPSDQSFFILLNDTLFRFEGQNLKNICSQIKRCDYICEGKLLCIFINTTLTFILLNDSKSKVIVQEAEYFVMHPFKKRVLLIKNKTLSVANIEQQSLSVIQTAVSPQSDISSAVFSQNGSILTFSLQENSVILWTLIQCQTDQFFQNNSCICPLHSNRSNGTCKCEVIRVLEDHSCNCIDKSKQNQLGKCVCESGREFNGSNCVCVDYSELSEEGECICNERRYFDGMRCACKQTFTELQDKCVCLVNQFLSAETNCVDCSSMCDTCEDQPRKCINISRDGYLFISGLFFAFIGSLFLIVFIVKKIVVKLKNKFAEKLITSESELKQ